MSSERAAMPGDALAADRCVERVGLRDFRCFPRLEIEFAPGANLIVGENARGKTSLLEAVRVMLRLQSHRANGLADLVRHGARGLVIDGHCRGRHLQVYFSTERRKLALDSVEQRRGRDYLDVATAVVLSNDDIRIVRDGASGRRRFLDAVGSQLDAGYRITLRNYERALRNRNRLLKRGGVGLRGQLAAFDRELVTHGRALSTFRGGLIGRLSPLAAAAYDRIAVASRDKAVRLDYMAGSMDDLAASLDASLDDDIRSGQTRVGPHRDDLGVSLDGRSAADFASEGEQRSLALALRIAEGALLAEGRPDLPIYLIDDIFGELDRSRRNALLDALPREAQWLITCTQTEWLDRAGMIQAGFRIDSSGIRAV